MNDLDSLAFAALFKEVFAKCFGHGIENPMTETESKVFCNKVLDQTGLSIGWKSVKNYSFFVIGGDRGKAENPSTATLDTLARYVLNAPYTSEIKRKDNESHYPYWFLYREKISRSAGKPDRRRWFLGTGVILTGTVLIILSVIYFKYIVTPAPSGSFTDNFKDTNEASLLKNGWMVKAKDTVYWDKRDEIPGQLTLYTLKGDNWPDPSAKPAIRNLLLRRLPAGCFTAEVHLSDFIPAAEWQQAGILLLDDTVLTGKSIRLSLAFNDNFGGRKMPSEIYVQAICSLGDGFGKPEELAHKPLFYPDSIRDNPVMLQNLHNSALRIEKHGSKFRFLYSVGATENGAFKEIVTHDFDMSPKYIGIFAIKGFTNSVAIPVRFKFFRITADACN
jgi:Beta xylosidase C-terminal Concanavalin A-like domain